MQNAPTNLSSVVMRRLDDHDHTELARLAAVDSATVPEGTLLGAEQDGRLLAAISLNGGAVIADPMRPTADAVELLRLRARQLSPSGRARRFRLARRPRPRGAVGPSPPGAGGRLLRL